MREYNRLSAVLTEQMAAHRLSAREVSNLAGIDLSTMRRFVNGRYRSTSVRNLVVLARMFGYSLADFLDTIA